MPPPPACAPGQAVDEEGFVRIGGIEQWVTVRGDDCANPIVLFLHGGPGNPLSPYADAVYGAWESEFTLVQWDQRGAGRTFGRDPAPADLTIALMTADGLALTDHLRERFGQRRIILVGSSWGSVLAVHMAKARPELFHAYVGAAQLVSYRANQAASYRQLLARARTAADEAMIATLEAMGSPPWSDPRAFGILRRATRVYERQATTPPPAGWWTASAGYADAASQAALEGGEDFSYLQFVGRAGDGMLSRVDLPSLGPVFEIPVFLIHGAEDLVTTPDVAHRYFDFLSAPEKEFRLLPATGHDPNAALVEAQHDMLVRRVLPIVRRR